MRKFNLLEAKAGRSVCLRNGQKARIVSFDKQGDCPLVVLVSDKDDDGDEYEYVLDYPESGALDSAKSDYDLMMDDETRTLWFNVYRSKNLSGQVCYILGGYFGSREYAQSLGKPQEGYVDTVKVTFNDEVQSLVKD